MYPSCARTDRVGRRRCIQLRERSLIPFEVRLARQGLTWVHRGCRADVDITNTLLGPELPRKRPNEHDKTNTWLSYLRKGTFMYTLILTLYATAPDDEIHQTIVGFAFAGSSSVTFCGAACRYRATGISCI
ncbi:hypothetical protein J3F84DRAFT_356943 [Trichoderma pleuroticola]